MRPHPPYGHAPAAYLDAVLRRAHVSMDAEDFRPDWPDQPWNHKVYEGLPAVPLPARGPDPGAPLAGTLQGATAGAGTVPAPRSGFTVASLSGMLRHSYGWLSRRLQVTADPGQGGREAYAHAAWSRGSAAGGGLYPCEIYWVCGPGAPLLPGVYHYDQPLHGLRRLLTGDVSGRVRAALGGAGDRDSGSDSDSDSDRDGAGDERGAATGTGQFLLVTVRFWQNFFKYGEFGYHCVTMDVGCLLRTWQTWAAACGTPVHASLWFDEPGLDALLGLRPEEESVLAVLPLPWPQPRADGEPRSTAAPRLQVGARVRERSARVRRFPAAEGVHLAALAESRTPAPGTFHAAAARAEAPARAQQPARAGQPARAKQPAPAAAPGLVPLPSGRAPGGSVPDALSARRSSFGRFTSGRPLPARDLATLLAVAGHGHHLHTDARPADRSEPLTRVAVFVQHVTGVPPGVYDYRPGTHDLVPLPGEAPAPFLQRAYTLNNYNLEQAAAVLVVLARPHAVLDAGGPRGYRLLNAEVGALAQSVYLAAAGLGVGCGAALGFDNLALAERLGRGPEGDTWPLLLLMAGHERTGQAGFDASLAPPDARARQDHARARQDHARTRQDHARTDRSALP